MPQISPKYHINEFQTQDSYMSPKVNLETQNYCYRCECEPHKLVELSKRVIAEIGWNLNYEKPEKFWKPIDLWTEESLKKIKNKDYISTLLSLEKMMKELPEKDSEVKVLRAYPDGKVIRFIEGFLGSPYRYDGEPETELVRLEVRIYVEGNNKTRFVATLRTVTETKWLGLQLQSQKNVDKFGVAHDRFRTSTAREFVNLGCQFEEVEDPKEIVQAHSSTFLMAMQ
jgi:hypothetical protein